MWDALLAGARLRRAPRLRPSPEPPAFPAGAVTGAMVRAYVPPQGERTRALTSASATGEAR